MTETKQKVIFKDQICDAKWRKKSMRCHKGTLKFTGDNVADFWLYRTWCGGCDRIRIADRQDFNKRFRKFVRAVEKAIE